MRALLLLPDCSTRELLHHLLTERGWRVVLARTGADAVERFRARPCGLVVVDDDLPDGSAEEVCRRIRAEPSGADAFVLVVTPATDREAVRRLAESGVDDYVVRPLSHPRLIARIDFAEGRIARSGAAPRRGGGLPHPDRLAELEETVQVQQVLLEGLFQSAPEGIVVMDEKERIVRVNSEFLRMFGYPEEEARGRSIDDLIIPDPAADEAITLTEGVRRGECYVLETVRRHRSGRLIDVSVMATPIETGGRLIGGYAIYRDITARRASERALQESEARYRALFDQSPVGVFLCDAELRITHCNGRLTEIVGLAEKEIVGTSLLDLPDERILPGLSRARAGEPAFYEGPYRAVRGALKLWISVQYAPLRAPDGTAIGGVGVLEDITSRELAEQQLRAQAAELERVNEALRERTLELEAALQARSRLYSSMNHELRTPLSAVMLYLELLLAGSLGELNEEQREAMEGSHIAASHLLELVQDVLDLSKIEAGTVSVHPVNVRLPTVLRDLRDTVLPLAQRYGSGIHLDVEPAEASLVTDPQRLRQILLNLLSNAAKFGRGRPIVLRARTDDDGSTRIEVVDRGIGISASDLPLIFEDFVQVGSSAKEGGTGLGLAISRRLAGMLGGRLQVESELGRGSTFRLVLPPSRSDHESTLAEEEGRT